MLPVQALEQDIVTAYTRYHLMRNYVICHIRSVAFSQARRCLVLCIEDVSVLKSCQICVAVFLPYNIFVCLFVFRSTSEVSGTSRLSAHNKQYSTLPDFWLGAYHAK